MEDIEHNRGKLITKLYKNETRGLLNEPLGPWELFAVIL